ncbi:hypothetical protein BS78_07G052000 [Paspalum vaginatum]|nr:hypothetical protein BS78_07G052000 [Paspalum vaginatum]
MACGASSAGPPAYLPERGKNRELALGPGNSARIGFSVACTAVAIAISVAAAVDPLEQGPSLACFALTVCMAFHCGVALIFRGVRAHQHQP